MTLAVRDAEAYDAILESEDPPIIKKLEAMKFRLLEEKIHPYVSPWNPCEILHNDKLLARCATPQIAALFTLAVQWFPEIYNEIMDKRSDLHGHVGVGRGEDEVFAGSDGGGEDGLRGGPDVAPHSDDGEKDTILNHGMQLPPGGLGRSNAPDGAGNTGGSGNNNLAGAAGESNNGPGKRK